MATWKVNPDFIGKDVAVAYPQLVPTEHGPQFYTVGCKLVSDDDGAITVLMNVNGQSATTQIPKEKIAFLSCQSGIKTGIGMIDSALMSRIKGGQ